MKTYTVLLDSKTVGEVKSEHEPQLGETATVELSDENGNRIHVTGVVEEVLEARDPWN